jgi:hypothetical protein
MTVVVCVDTPCSVPCLFRYFGRTHYLHVQGEWIGSGGCCSNAVTIKTEEERLFETSEKAEPTTQYPNPEDHQHQLCLCHTPFCRSYRGTIKSCLHWTLFTGSTIFFSYTPVLQELWYAVNTTAHIPFLLDFSGRFYLCVSGKVH